MTSMNSINKRYNGSWLDISILVSMTPLSIYMHFMRKTRRMHAISRKCKETKLLVSEYSYGFKIELWLNTNKVITIIY